MNTALIPWTRYRRSAAPARRVFAFQPEMLYSEFDKMFDALLGGPSEANADGQALYRPHMDICGDGRRYFVTVEVPGVAEKDLHVELEGQTLRIRGEKHAEREEKSDESGESAETPARTFYRVERCYGSFERVLTLPDDVDASAISASHENGVLTLTLPRKEEVLPENRTIEINKA